MMGDNIFSKILNAIGSDIALLLGVIFIGVLLSMVYAGAGDTKTTEFSLIFLVVAFVCLVVAGVNRAAQKDFFYGADYSMVPALSSKGKPYLGLFYLIAGVVAGFALVAVANSTAFSFISNDGFFSSYFSIQSSVSPANFIFQNVFSPIVEEYFFRGFLFGVGVFVISKLLAARYKDGIAIKATAVFLAALISSLFFSFVHIAAFNGDASELFSSVVFGMVVAPLVLAFGILIAIGFHIGHNLGVLAIALGII